jgi:hypothetical protein
MVSRDWAPGCVLAQASYHATPLCRRRKPGPETAELKPVWVPKTDMERAVYSALIVAGKPVTNDEGSCAIAELRSNRALAEPRLCFTSTSASFLSAGSLRRAIM